VIAILNKLARISNKQADKKSVLRLVKALVIQAMLTGRSGYTINK
jgi:hypothetical protein